MQNELSMGKQYLVLPLRKHDIQIHIELFYWFSYYQKHMEY